LRLEDPRLEVRSPRSRFEIRGPRSEVQGSRSDVRGRLEARSRFQARGPRFEVRDPRSKVRGRGPRFGVSRQKVEISGPSSSVHYIVVALIAFAGPIPSSARHKVLVRNATTCMFLHMDICKEIQMKVFISGLGCSSHAAKCRMRTRQPGQTRIDPRCNGPAER